MLSPRIAVGITLLAGVALSLASGNSFQAAAAPVPPVAGACGTAAAPMTGVKFITATSLNSTDSVSFVTVGSTQISFNQARAGCVIVAFSAEVENNTDSGYVQVQALLDNTTPCEPPIVLFGGHDTNVTSPLKSSRAMNFICKSVAAGSHTIKILYRTSGAASTATIGARSTILHFMQ